MSQPSQSGGALPDGCRLSVRGVTWKVDATTVHAVQQLCAMSVGRPAIERLRLRIRHGQPPRGWVGSPGLPSLTAASIRDRGTGSQIELNASEPVDPALLLAAALRMARPWAGRVGPVISLAPGLPARAAPLAPYLRDVALPIGASNPHLRRHDVVVAPADLGILAPAIGPGVPAPSAAASAPGAAASAPSAAASAPSAGVSPLDVGEGPDGAGTGPARTGVRASPRESTEHPLFAQLVVIEPGAGDRTWHVGGHSRKVLVDPSVHRPIGRRSNGAHLIGSATLRDAELCITAEGLDIRVRGDLSSRDVHRLRAVAGLIVPPELPEHWRAQLQACGVVLALTSGQLPIEDLQWQVDSVRERVAALRDLGPQAALGEWPSVSVVLLTRREDCIHHAVNQLSKLDYPRLQFVIGLHGISVPQGRLAQLEDMGEAIVVPLDGSASFGEAMQHACERSDGDLIAKVDDDDFYSPSHLWDLVVARQYSGAQIVGKALDWIHVSPDDVTVFRPSYPAEQYATFVAGGTMLISKSDLVAVGGWRPVERAIDRGLIDRVRAAGGLVYRTHGLGYLYMRGTDGHTAQARNAHFLTNVAQQWPGLLAHPALGTEFQGE